MEITQDQYTEYEQLLKWKKKEDIRLSLGETKNLEDDIDWPIKSCVMMFALLGAKPFFSCCGFDYEGQPYHKSHQYGEPYILFRGKPDLPGDMPSMWEFRLRTSYDDSWMVVLKEDYKRGPHWNDPDCIHFSEILTIAITVLEKWLWKVLNYKINKDHPFYPVTLTDGNVLNTKSNPYWQYKPRKSWTFDVNDLSKYLLELYENE